jgi:hypothetical protein
VTVCKPQKEMAPQVGLEPTTLRLTGGAEPFSTDYCGCIQVPQTTCSRGFQNNMRLLPITATFCQGSPVKSPVLKHAFPGPPCPPGVPPPCIAYHLSPAIFR